MFRIDNRFWEESVMYLRDFVTINVWVGQSNSNVNLHCLTVFESSLPFCFSHLTLLHTQALLWRPK